MPASAPSSRQVWGDRPPVASTEAVIWDRVETLPREQLEVLQLRRLRSAVARVLRGQPPGAGRLAAAGITASGDIGSLADLSRIPFTGKAVIPAAASRSAPGGWPRSTRATAERSRRSCSTSSCSRGSVSTRSQITASVLATGGRSPRTSRLDGALAGIPVHLQIADERRAEVAAGLLH